VFVPRTPAAHEAVLHTHQVRAETASSCSIRDAPRSSRWFELIIGVRVGPRAALAILSVSRPVDVAPAIASGDAAPFSGQAATERPSSIQEVRSLTLPMRCTPNA